MIKRTALHYGRWELAMLLVLTIIAVVAAEWLWNPDQLADDRTADAAQQMHEATVALAEHRTVHGPPLDADDVNRTGLIGTFFSPLTTTVGTLEAKRTTTNPNMAALAVHLLTEAGVQQGDAIAVGASGSFPAILLAVLCAAGTLDLDVGLIVSLGASQWGANVIDFTWLDMQEVLIGEGLLHASYRAAGASLGGAGDMGTEFDADVRDTLRARVVASGTRLIEEPDLQRNVVERMQIYQTAVGGCPVAAFVNIGGAWANVGRGETILKISPGVNVIDSLPETKDRGVLFEYAAHDVPIVHFLHISALTAAYALPWDPSPLPAPGTRLDRGMSSSAAVLAIAIAYILLAGLWLVSIRYRQAHRRAN